MALADHTEKFDGKVGSYVAFRGAFIADIHRSIFQVARKFRKLSELVKRHMPGHVHTLNPSQESYGLLIEQLELKYGGKHRTWRYYLQQLQDIPHMEKPELKAMTELHDCVKCYLDALGGANSRGEADSLTLVTQVQAKLPQSVINDYHNKIQEKGWEDSEAYKTTHLLDYLMRYQIGPLNRESDNLVTKSASQNARRNDKLERKRVMAATEQSTAPRRPVQAEGKAKADEFPDFATETGFKSPQKHFIDDIVYDGTKPNEYISKFPIGLKSGDKL